MADKSIREELAELTEAVRELREDEVTAELRRLRAEVEKLRAENGCHAHVCHCVLSHCNFGHCGCHVFHSYTYPLVNTTVTQPVYYTVSSGTTSVTATNGYLSSGTMTALGTN